MLEGLQKLGRALMLPVAVLPVAAVLLRLGAPDLLHVGFLFQAGEAVFANLPLIFAVGVAVGFAQEGRGAAALAGTVGYLVLKAALGALAPAVDMGALGGILAGMAAAFAANRFGRINLPQWLAFFGGRRFVPIATAALALALAGLASLAYPPVQAGMRATAEWVIASGPLGAGVYGVVNRLLIPTGLHHLLNNIVWFQFGDFTTAAGAVVHGDLHRFFAGDPAAGTFMAGFFPVMLCGLPGACLAMYACADPDKKAATGGMLAGAALTAMVTGVTEPVEYLFMFLAPGLYAVHALLTGISMAVCAWLGVKLGFGFSAGLIDYALSYGMGTRPWLVLPLGAAAFGAYYGAFVLCIRAFDLKTPGRGESTLPPASPETCPDTGPSAQTRAYAEALGGLDNLIETTACITRLRLTLRDPSLADATRLAALGAKGVVRVGERGLQVVVGTQADLLATAIRNLAASSTAPDIRPAASTASAAPVAPVVRSEAIYAPLDGEIVPIEDVPDPVFAAKTAGDGLGIRPTSGLVVAPADGQIGTIFETNHAFSMLTDMGAELVVHCGIDTVKLGGQGFTRLAEPGAQVHRGDPILRFDPAALEEQGVITTTPVVVSNLDEFHGLDKASGTVRAGLDPIMIIRGEKNEE